jgi:uncharacterized protein (TIGR02996 family)
MSPEKGFLDAIVREPDVLDHRLVYADWLEEQGELRRAEFLRLEVALARGTTNSRARLRELLPEIGADWLALLDRTAILNCHRGDTCPGRWERLGLTRQARVRQCAACNRHVHHARTEAEARNLHDDGQIVAADSRLELVLLELLPLDPLSVPDVDAVRDALLRLRATGPRRKRRK